MNSTSTSATLTEFLSGSPYVSYAYSYPHKTAYRTLEPAVSLRDLWSVEDRSSLFLYLHIPFCEYRCGFCNLFTQAQPGEELPSQYLAQLKTEAERVRDALGEAKFSRLAIGGGTPTFLNLEELETLRSVFHDVMGADSHTIPVSVEASPATLDAEKLSLLNAWGVDRISVGIQSFDEREAALMGRPQRQAECDRLLQLLADANLPRVNLDLIYGGDNQTVNSFLDSVRRVIDFRPAEVYLYPLYVRPLTGLGQRAQTQSRTQQEWDCFRLNAYRAGRDLLCESGYEQVSMRMFQDCQSATENGPVYCCQTDGMIGLGCGARSYSTHLHYSTEYAVGKRGVQAILKDYLSRNATDFEAARHGYFLDEEDRKRRFLILSLLQKDGLSLTDYQSCFHSDPQTDFPGLQDLILHQLATCNANTLQLTAAGLERSDMIGPWLNSAKVQQRIREYDAV